jgi:class 3 adenylate cyclase
MALADDLRAAVQATFSQPWNTELWDTRPGQVLPETDDLQPANHAVELDGTVLCAEIANSTELVEDHSREFAAELYRAYLYCASRAIDAHGGQVAAYGGHRLVGVFIGPRRNTHAAIAALTINGCVRTIINPGFLESHGGCAYQIQHVLGIDTGALLAARTGVRCANDLVWVGRAVTCAGRLAQLPHDRPLRITEPVYKRLTAEAKVDDDGRDIWERDASSVPELVHYRSAWMIEP